ncbi:LysR family transcriptional regulator [Vibrio tubiashii]|uniref:LysR family transcriptional regulator n=1 Tax=Vibrio tubiashii TaxID=29498 RepID=A0AAE5GNA4_9VIBR|nr:LysR family transcriptional regulator [Vibrio tubiashii]NOI79962.1 LysR family transcriptional regulator [Vibrio tubiashii]
MLLNYLKPMVIFAKVVETGSFTKAGKHLGMPRGKVSEQVFRLETYLGSKLLQRSTRKVTVTAEGEALYKHASQLLKLGIEGAEEVKSFSEEIKGTIKLTATDDVYQWILLPILKRYSNTYPNVQFDLQITEQPLSIIDDSIDLAIRSGVLPDSNLISIPLTSTKLKLYASAQSDTPLPHSPSQLESCALIALTDLNRTQSIVLTHHSGKQETIRPNYKHSASTVSSYCLLIEQGFGFGLMSEQTAQLLVDEGKLVPVLPDWHYQNVSISLLYPARLNMAKRTRLLIDEICAELKSTS